MINIFIVDDHDLIIEGLKKILKNNDDINIVGETKDPFHVVSELHQKEVHVLILDISMPGKGGLDVLKDVKKLFPNIGVLIFSMHPEERFAKRALKAGAAGYITKESAYEELVLAIRKVHTEGKYVSPALAEKMASNIHVAPNTKPHDILSDREFQVLTKIASGKTQSDIARELFLSVSTINTYRSRILEKLHLSSNVELIHYALVNKLID